MVQQNNCVSTAMIHTLYAESGRVVFSFCNRKYFSITLLIGDLSFLSLVMEFSMLNESSTHPKSGSKLDDGYATKHRTLPITLKMNGTFKTMDKYTAFPLQILSICDSVSSFHQRNLNLL